MDAPETTPARAVVAVLTRAPGAGGKSRLFDALGIAPDLGLSTALLLDTLAGVASAAWSCIVFVEPASACAEVRPMLPGVTVLPQRGAELGARMRAAMDDSFASGASAVALIGSDLPEIDRGAITAAFATLQQDPATLVLGPARDGGYYLIAATRTPPVFSGVEWGGPDVLSATIAAARRQHIDVQLVGPGDDVDGVEDLRRLARAAQDAPAAARAPRTRAWLRARGLMDRLK